MPHLLVLGRVDDEPLRRRGGGGNAKIRPVERRAHGRAILSETHDAFEQADDRRALFARDELEALGSFITLVGGQAIYPLKVESLEQRTRHRTSPKLPKWLLMSVHPATGGEPERAVVWVADASRESFLKLFQDYLDDAKVSTKAQRGRWVTPEGNPRNVELVANIAVIRATVLRDLWQSTGEPLQFGTQWWEVWLEPTDDGLALLRRFAAAYGLTLLERTLRLGNRVVAWINATWADLELLPFTAVPLAEVRRPQFVDTIEDLTVQEQDEYVVDLAGRVYAAPQDAPAVCHLDTGVARTHALLAGSLDPADLHDVIGGSGFDVQGHGTKMAGLALFGALDATLLATGPLQLTHRLESVRMLPNPGEPQTLPRDYGTVTVQAVALPEATTDRHRVFCMPVSTDPDGPGQPTLWSATIDALAVGTDVVRDEAQLQLLSAPDPLAARLFVVSAGNVKHFVADHLAESDTAAIDDPGQAWNALTVGAHTDLTHSPSHPDYRGWRALAPTGELSPHSRTSLLYEPKWPLKPDICMEGGNVLTDGASMFEPNLPTLSLRTTGHANDLALGAANATSAATAQAARLAALAMHRYPGYWPESIRGLLVHAAEWTPAMRGTLDHERRVGKRQQFQMLRRYGWGVPTEDSVLSSTRHAVTLVTQDEFVPFEGKAYAMRRFRLHSLPWPTDALAAIAAADVRLRVTLSYFIEPSPSRRGWRQRYSYASHGLRFEIKNPTETPAEFIRRVGRAAADDEAGTTSTSSGSERWLVGVGQRNVGSLHQDIWEGSGQELAASGYVAVYPVGGWWKRNGRKDRLDLPVRYSLLISLATPSQGVDLYTPIATELRVPIVSEIVIE
ncbi:S8 family peptidase [uncultured Cellulomonas sp.]|uniref:S8 family peptidase n=1 Tax=uncultured Cellulomonas sp. TaxID=189682 RepID=UPI0028E3DFB9|nr:S8 family peptidase [uncultured Cellulomonas sp.]